MSSVQPANTETLLYSRPLSERTFRDTQTTSARRRAELLLWSLAELQLVGAKQVNRKFNLFINKLVNSLHQMSSPSIPLCVRVCVSGGGGCLPPAECLGCRSFMCSSLICGGFRSGLDLSLESLLGVYGTAGGSC